MSAHRPTGKTELTIRPIALRGVDLALVADAVAEALGLERGAVQVTDVLGDQVVVDVLRGAVDPRDLVGKEDELRRRLARVPGVECGDATRFSSRGMLSWIAVGRAEGEAILDRSEAMAREIRSRLQRSAIVFSTGAEVVDGQIADANAPLLRERLQAGGWRVKLGGALRDDEILIAARLRQAADDGYGLVLTTGGVGAEDKDRTVEAVLRADPGAATPSVVTYELGVGRHRHKDSVRIAVGRIAGTLVAALPGPTGEAEVGVRALLDGLAAGAGPQDLAERIAEALRRRLRQGGAGRARHHGEG